MFFLVGLARGLSILFIFSTNLLLFLVKFSVIFLVSISFTSALIFVISFLILTLGLPCFSFSKTIFFLKQFLKLLFKSILALPCGLWILVP